MDKMLRGVFDVANVESRDFTRISEEEFQKLSDKQDKAYEIIERELPALRENLVVCMRQTVGIVSHDVK